MLYSLLQVHGGLQRIRPACCNRWVNKTCGVGFGKKMGKYGGPPALSMETGWGNILDRPGTVHGTSGQCSDRPSWLMNGYLEMGTLLPHILSYSHTISSYIILCCIMPQLELYLTFQTFQHSIDQLAMFKQLPQNRAIPRGAGCFVLKISDME